MKRMWIGIGLLAGILIAGIWLWVSLGSLHGRLSDDLTQAAELARQENWQEATAVVGDARARWEKHRYTTAAFTEHAPLEQMDTLFAELEIYAKEQLSTEYAVVCIQLSRLAEAVEESLSLKWWSLL